MFSIVTSISIQTLVLWIGNLVHVYMLMRPLSQGFDIRSCAL